MKQKNWPELAAQLRDFLGGMTEATKVKIEICKSIVLNQESENFGEEYNDGIWVIPVNGATFYHLDEVSLFCKYHQLSNYVTIDRSIENGGEIIRQTIKCRIF